MSIFKLGDRVFAHPFGWCTVVDFSDKNDLFVFESDNSWDGKTEHYFSLKFAKKIFSFTEYELKGFSQERPVDYNDYIGCWGVLWGDCEDEEKIIGKLYSYTNKISVLPFHLDKAGAFKNFQPLTDEQLKALGLTNKSK